MKVSVALCTFNGENYLKDQIDSILNQTRKVDEIVVCDDRSTDSTFEILEAYLKSHPVLFKIVKNGTTLRSVKNFEKAIGLCTGDIIFLSDQDDSWLPNKVSETINYFEKHDYADAVFTNAFFIDKSNNFLNNDLWNSIFFNPQKKYHSNLILYLVLKRNCVTGATLCIKKEVKDYAFPFPEISNFHHDYWIAFLVASRNKLGFVNKKLIKYRIHTNQQVSSPIKNSKFKKLKNYFGDQYLFENKKYKLFSNHIRRKIMSNLILFLKLQQLYPNKIELTQAIKLLNEKLKN